MDTEFRKNIRQRWFDILFELSHFEFQKKVWIDASIEIYVSDHTEVVCSYFDDLNLEEGLESFSEIGFIAKKEAEIFLEFHDLFAKYIDKPEKKGLTDSEILQDIEWINLTKLANKIGSNSKKYWLTKQKLII